MKVYKRFRKYCIYNNEEYAVGKITDDTVDIVSNNSYKQKYGFIKDGEVYINTIAKADIGDMYRLDTKILYSGFLFYGDLNTIFIDGSGDGLETLALRLGFNMQNRGEYSKNITEDEIDYVAISRYYMEELKGFKFNNDDVNNRFKIINFVQKGKYKWNEYNVSIKDDKIRLSTEDTNLIDDTFTKKVFHEYTWYNKEIGLGELSQHYGIKCFGIYKGIKCEVYSVIPGIMLTVAPDTEEEKQNLLELGFYISNTDLNYCEKIVKPEEVELIYERIEMGMF